MERRNHKHNERENYLVQEFDEDVQDKGIPSKILLHFGLTHLLVGDKNEVLELLKLYFPKCSNAEQLSGEVFLNMVVLREPKKKKKTKKTQLTN